MSKTPKRHHFSARFYLRLFSHPEGAEQFQVYSFKSRQWHPGSTRSIGFRNRLYEMITDKGERSSEFESLLGDLESQAAPALKVAAENPNELSSIQRESIALFLSLAHARNPSVMKRVMQTHITQMNNAQKTADHHLLRSLSVHVRGAARNAAAPDGGRRAKGAVRALWSLSRRRYRLVGDGCVPGVRAHTE